MNESDARLDDLITRHLGAELDAQEEQELASRLADSAAARDLFASYMRVEGATMHLGMAGLLSNDLADESPTPAAIRTESTPAESDPSSRRLLIRTALALSACVAIGIGVYLAGKPPEKSATFAVPDAVTVAQLVRAVNVQWQHTGMPTSVGSAILPSLS